MADEFFLSRWSRRKTLARQGAPAEEETPAAVPVAPAVAGAHGVAEAGSSPATPPEPQPLPPVESLTADSDFSPFMKPDVDPILRRQALRKLLHDPRFNVMDGLDVYIEDFSKPDPLPPEWLGQLNQMARLGAYTEPDPEAAATEAAVGDPAQLAEAAPDEPCAPALESPEPLPADTSKAPDRVPKVDDPSSFGAAN